MKPDRFPIKGHSAIARSQRNVSARRLWQLGQGAARRLAIWPIGASVARLRQMSPRPTRFAGAFDSVLAARESLPSDARHCYDDEDLAGVTFETMARVALVDFPVIYWLQRWTGPGSHVLDMGGNLATKYLAFANHLDVQALRWTVQELPSMVRAAARLQSTGALPQGPRFVTSQSGLGSVDVVLASGLLQYTEAPLGELLSGLDPLPTRLLLNKVAMRDGPECVTLEQIGPNRVPYRIRDRAEFEAEFATLGYRIVDRWTNPAMSHRIPTHPWFGTSESAGYALQAT